MTNMDYKYIEQLLERYWNCETSLEEEKILRTFFSQKDIPARLLKYRDLFGYEQTATACDTLDESFDERIMAQISEPESVRARTIKMSQRLMPLFKAAAVVAMFLTLGNAAQVAFTGNDRPADGVATVRKTTLGPAVAMGDSVKTDTMQAVSATATIIK